MKSNSRIRFNPVTREIEIEGSESFVEAYFDKLQALMSEPSNKLPEKPKAARVVPVKTVKMESKAIGSAPSNKVKQPIEGESEEKKMSNISAVVALIQASAGGLSTAALKEKTGLSERQIWSVVNRASKEGKIRKQKRGVYVKA